MTAGRPTGHEPYNKGKTLPGTKKPARTSSSIVREIFDLIYQAHIPAATIANETGCHRVSMSRWKHGRTTPMITEVENMATVLGYRLALIPIDL